MGYHLIDPDDLAPLDDRPSTAVSISEAASLEILGLRIYTAEPGEQIPLRYHYHDEQEEAFFILEGDLHVETPEEEYIVPSGACFVVDPGSPHRAHNPEGSSTSVRLLAMGAPSKSDAHGYPE